MAEPPSEQEKPQGIGFGDRRLNLIGLVVLGLVLLGFAIGMTALVWIIIKRHV